MEVEEKKTKNKKQSSDDIIKGVRNFQTAKDRKQSMTEKNRDIKNLFEQQQEDSYQQ